MLEVLEQSDSFSLHRDHSCKYTYRDLHVNAALQSDYKKGRIKELADLYSAEVAQIAPSHTWGKRDRDDLLVLYSAMSGKSLEDAKKQFKGKINDEIAKAVADLANSDVVIKKMNEFAKAFPNLSKEAQKQINLAISEGTTILAGEVNLDENGKLTEEVEKDIRHRTYGCKKDP